jgi:hypothetical protein
MPSLFLRVLVFSLGLSIGGLWDPSHSVIAEVLAADSQPFPIDEFRNDIRDGNTQGIVNILIDATPDQISSLNPFAFNDLQVIKGVDQLTGDSLKKVIQNLPQGGLDSLIQGAARNQRPSVITKALSNAKPDQIRSLNPLAFNDPQVIQGIEGLTGDSLNNVIQNLPREGVSNLLFNDPRVIDKLAGDSLKNAIQNLPQGGLDSLIQGAARKQLPSVIAKALSNAKPDQIRSLNPLAFNDPQVIQGIEELTGDSLNNVIQNLPREGVSNLLFNDPGVIDKLTGDSLKNAIQNLPQGGLDSLIQGAARKQLSSVITKALSNAKPDQIRSMNPLAFNDPQVLKGVDQLTGDSLKNVIQNLPGGLDGLISGAARNQQASVITKALSNATPDQISALDPRAFKDSQVIMGMAGITNLDDFNRVDQSLTKDQLYNLVQGTQSTGDSELLDRAMSNLDPSQLPSGFTYTSSNPDTKAAGYFSDPKNPSAHIAPEQVFQPPNVISNTPVEPTQFIGTPAPKPSINNTDAPTNMAPNTPTKEVPLTR